MAKKLRSGDVFRQMKLAFPDSIASSRTRTAPQVWWVELARLVAVKDHEVVARVVAAVHTHALLLLTADVAQVWRNDRLLMETWYRTLASSMACTHGAPLEEGLLQMLTGGTERLPACTE